MGKTLKKLLNIAYDYHDFAITAVGTTLSIIPGEQMSNDNLVGILSLAYRW